MAEGFAGPIFPSMIHCIWWTAEQSRASGCCWTNKIRIEVTNNNDYYSALQTLDSWSARFICISTRTSAPSVKYCGYSKRSSPGLSPLPLHAYYVHSSRSIDIHTHNNGQPTMMMMMVLMFRWSRYWIADPVSVTYSVLAHHQFVIWSFLMEPASWWSRAMRVAEKSFKYFNRNNINLNHIKSINSRRGFPCP